MKVRKAVIPAAGLGTRFLPATKAQPKEMLPIVDKPTIQYIVEEAVASGIEDIIIISGRNKRAIEDHFDKSYELEETLVKKEKSDLLEQIQKISSLANIHYIRQKEANGLGDAISCARSFIGNEPFAVLLGDIIIDSEIPALKQITNTYNCYETSVIGVQQVKEADISKYGIVNPGQELQRNVYGVKNFIEKPPIHLAPSNYGIIGRYILQPEIFNILENTPPGSGNEIQLTDAIETLNVTNQAFAHIIDGKMYDIGDKLGFVKATIDFALKHEDLKFELEQFLRQKAMNLHEFVGERR